MRRAERQFTPGILLVDDESQPLELRAQIMNLHGLSVVTANDPIIAASMMAEGALEKIRIAALDYNMPGLPSHWPSTPEDPLVFAGADHRYTTGTSTRLLPVGIAVPYCAVTMRLP